MQRAHKRKGKTPARGVARKRRRGRSSTLTLLEDVSAIIARSHDLRDTLNEITRAVADRVEAEVCSLYILDQKEQQLTLWATTGLDHSAIGKVRMGVEEGLTGLVIQRMAPVTVVDAPAHPRYKYFPETGEERYHSFFGVPVIQRAMVVGVLVLLLLNLVRIVTLFLMQVHAMYELFDLGHKSLWPMAFMLVSIVLWALWARWAIVPPTSRA